MVFEKYFSRLREASRQGIDRKKAYRIIYAAALVMAVIFAGYYGYGKYSASRRLAVIKKDEMKRFSAMEGDYLRKKTAVDFISRKALSGAGSVVSIIESTGKRVGIKDRITMLKPLDESQSSGYRQKGAEVKMEGVGINQLVNFLYYTERGDFLVVIKDFSMKSRFDNPDLLDAKLRVYLITKEET